jgi:beta-N-acetylhexosaminidase
MGNWKYVFTVIALLGSFGFDTIQKNVPVDPIKKPEFLTRRTPWADQLIKKLTLDEKIGQLFMVPAYSNLDDKHVEELYQLVDTFKVGGLIFMQGGPVRQARLNNDLQNRSRVPLMVAMDAEWGLGMRLDSTISFPWQMALGAIDDPNLVYEFGTEAARELRRMGVHVSFSPVVDVNNNSANPVINARSFGENREQVATRGIAYMKGLQDHNVLACAKHFPGHGDTDVDSHEDLPLISHNRDRLDSIELYPFRRLVKRGLGSAMVAHLYIPALDTTRNCPSTLSKPTIDGVLKKEMGFKGLIFTDAMTMKGLANYYEPGAMHVAALKAGNDVLLFPGDVAVAFTKIKEAIANGELTEADITEKCYKILKFKEWCGLPFKRTVEVAHIVEDLNNSRAQAVHQKLAAESLTLLKNDQDLLPIQINSYTSIAVLNVGEEKNNAFTERFAEHFSFDTFSMAPSPDFSTSKYLVDTLSTYDLVVVNILKSSRRPSTNYGVNQQSVRLANSIAGNTKVILNIFSNPYALGNLLSPDRSDALLIAYHDDEMTQKVVADALAGATPIRGRLPITAYAKYPSGSGISTNPLNVLRHVSPDLIGADIKDLARIDSIANEGIMMGAYPGCRVLAAKGGQIFYDKSFGNQTYDGGLRVDQNTVYDVASITKIVASTLSLMKLQDDGVINVDYNLCDYLPLSDDCDYYNMNLREMLSHFAKLKDWIPFYLNTLEGGVLKPELFRTEAEDGYRTEVSSGLYIKDSYRDSIYANIISTPLRVVREYKYSDLGYYFVQDIIERKTGLPLNEYAMQTFYKPLDLNTIGYLPLERLPLSQVAPTENDTYFRHQSVHGHVHDPGAAMMGGVGGHAGIFSDAYDLAVLMQMLLNGGEYGGERFLQQETVNYFTDCHYCDQDNRRGIGFDKPTKALNSGPTCNSVSAESFGHSGFTGTLVWADPEHDIVYVFLSNRVYPDGANRKLLDLDIRTRIQQAIYDAFDIPARAVLSSPFHN